MLRSLAEILLQGSLGRRNDYWQTNPKRVGDEGHVAIIAGTAYVCFPSVGRGPVGGLCGRWLAGAGTRQGAEAVLKDN